MLKVGDTIPDKTLPDQNGKEQNLLEIVANNGAIVYFYPKDNTPGCTVEANDFQRLGPDFQALGVNVIGISKDSVKSHANFCQKQGLEFTLLSDTEGEICEAFGVWQEKKNYGKTYMGLVRTTFMVNGQGKILKIYPNVKTKGHGDKVLADLKTRQNA